MKFGNACHRGAEEWLLSKGAGWKVGDFDRFAEAEGLKAKTWGPKVERRLHVWEHAARDHSWHLLKPEQSLAFNVTTGAARALEGQGWRKYSGVDRTCEITLAIDANEVRDGVAHAYDWKTGRVNQVKDLGQIRVCALALARLHGVDKAVGHVVYIDDEECIDYQGGLTVAEFDMLGLEATLERIFRLEDSEPIIGPHCKSLYCPAKESCMSYVIAHDPVIGGEGRDGE